MLSSSGDRHLGIPYPDKGTKGSQVTKLSRTTSELVETKTQTDYEVHQYLASTAAVQTSLNEDITAQTFQVPQLGSTSHIRVNHSPFEEAVFERTVWDCDYTALAEHIIDNVEFETYLDEYASATEHDNPNRCLVQLFNLILDLALRSVSGSREPAIRMTMVSQALPVGTNSTHPVCFAAAQQQDNTSGVIRGWRDAIFLLEMQSDPRDASIPDVQLLSSHPITIPFAGGTVETVQGCEPSGPRESDNSQHFGLVLRHRSGSPGCTKRAMTHSDGPIGIEPRRKRQRIGRRQHPSSKVTSEMLSRPGIHHPCNVPTSDMAACALEMFSALGNRRYLLAISVSGLQGRFWYFDRAGTISTEEISVSDLSFIAILLRMFFATPYQLGFEHSFEVPSEELVDTEPDHNTRQAQAWPHFNDIKDYRVVLTGHTLFLDRVLHSSRCLYGRGTAVYAADVHSQTPDPDPGASNLIERSIPSTVVLKLSWRPASHPDEGELFRLANEAGVEGVPKLWTACRIRQLSHCARGRLTDPSQYEGRELRAQVMTPVCIPLHQIPSALEFKHAFISLVKGK